MIEYKILEASSAHSLTALVNEAAADGFVLTGFSTSIGGHYAHFVYACVMEREKP